MRTIVISVAECRGIIVVVPPRIVVTPQIAIIFALLIFVLVFLVLIFALLLLILLLLFLITLLRIVVLRKMNAWQRIGRLGRNHGRRLWRLRRGSHSAVQSCGRLRSAAGGLQVQFAGLLLFGRRGFLRLTSVRGGNIGNLIGLLRETRSWHDQNHACQRDRRGAAESKAFRRHGVVSVVD